MVAAHHFAHVSNMVAAGRSSGPFAGASRGPDGTAAGSAEAWQRGVNGGVKCPVKRVGLEGEKMPPKRAHFVPFGGGKNGLKMGLDGQLGGQMGGRFVQA